MQVEVSVGIAVERDAVAEKLTLVQKRRLRVWAWSVLGVVGFLALQTLWPALRVATVVTGQLSPHIVLALLLTALGCEYIDSSMGMGYGTTLTPLLLLAGFDPLQIVPCILLSELLTGVTAAALHHHDGNVDLFRDPQARSTALTLSVLSAVGAFAAVSFAIRLPKAWLQGIISAIVLSMGVITLASARRHFTYRRHRMIAIGVIAAFNKGLSGGGYGPLVTSGQVVSGIGAKKAVAITSLAESLTCLVGLATYLLLGKGIDWPLALPLTIGALLSVPAATLTVRSLSEKAMRVGVGVATCALGLLTLAKWIW